MLVRNGNHQGQAHSMSRMVGGKESLKNPRYRMLGVVSTAQGLILLREMILVTVYIVMGIKKFLR
jgi:hypothetical protein